MARSGSVLGTVLIVAATGFASVTNGTAWAQGAALPRAFGLSAGAEEKSANPFQPPREGGSPPADGARPPESDESSESSPDESPRLTRLKALNYNRSPSAILKAWAEIEAEQTKPDDAEPTDSQAADVPDNDAADSEAEKELSAEEAAAKAAAEALEQELKTLQRNVTLGRWTEVKSYLAQIPEEEGQAGYERMLVSLGSPPVVDGEQQPQIAIPGFGILGENHKFALDDLIGLAAASPHELERESVSRLGVILQQAMQSGLMLEAVIERLTHESARDEGEAVLNRIQCAWLLETAGQVLEAQPFLPTVEEAIAEGDAETLIFIARCILARYNRDGTPELLEQTWSTLQSVASLADIDGELRQTALRMTIDLLPRIKDEVSGDWLTARFTGPTGDGMELLEVTGSASAAGLLPNAHNPDARLANLRLQKLVIESLLETDPDRAADWGDTLELLAFAWLHEAQISRLVDRSTFSGPRMQRDRYGNLYYVNDGDMEMQRQVAQAQEVIRAIRTADVLSVIPNEDWLAFVSDSIRPKFAHVTAQLHLKVSDAEEAFPYIEHMAQSHPELARDLVHEFIRTWTRNHDPNSSTRYTNPYMFMYGFERRAGSIPLTRSKQARNLEELAGWVRRIRDLNIDDLDESLFAKAFTTCHSRAEVYRIESIEEVFGSIDSLQPETLAQFVQQMRQNLVSVWRMPAEQEAAQTQRKQQDIEAEVRRGYTVVSAVAADAIEKYPEDWSLHLAQACVMLDEISYLNQIAPSSEFSARRGEALDRFRHAAELYAATVPSLKQSEQSAEVYQHWFYAGLGASDLNRIDHESTPDPRQPGLIRDAILALPGEASEHHLGMFANALFTRMSGLSPAVKFSYLDAGFEIAGDAEQAREARKVYDYYRDLVTEIKLVTRVDGSTRIDADRPFGVFVELLHTREIEREAGGFGKYLQNQNNMAYAYNYGRPLENYRDKFEEAARVALEEHFDILSVTFQEPDIHSRAAEEYGWRITPYAYLLLQPNGPQVDKIPSLKIDLDFLDTSGYAVLPVTSSPLPIDAAAGNSRPRPYENLTITQTLDERQAGEGELILEIRASARGLVPPLDEIMDLRRSDFEVKNVEDEGVLISRFDPESGDPAVISERTWMISYVGRTDLEQLPTEFSYPTPLEDASVAQVDFFRYNDADLETVESTVVLEHEYGEVAHVWPWILAGGGLLLLAAGFGFRALTRRSHEQAEHELQLPETLTPFNVLNLLRDLERKNGFDAAKREELATSIQSLERHYFAEGNGQDEPDLRQVAIRWLVKS